MTKSLASAWLLALVACSSPHKNADNEAAPTPPANVDPSPVGPTTGQPGTPQLPGKGKGTGDGKGPALATVDTHLSLQLSLAASATAADHAVYFVDVQATFQKCLPCHGGGGGSPNLTAFPFTNTSGQTLSSLMTNIAGRINNDSRPMPPTGLLPAGERSTLTRWISAGFPSTAAAPAKSKALESYALDLTWSSDQGLVQTAHVAGSDSGTFDLALGVLPVGAKISVRAKVTGPKGRVVFDSAFAPQVLAPTGVLTFPVRALAVDVEAPTLSGSAVVRASDVTQTSAKIAWDLATDNASKQADLVYSVYKSTTDTLDTADHVKATGTLIGSPLVNVASVVADGLAAGGKYFFNVIVKDTEGNETPYLSLAVQTLTESVAADVAVQLNLVQPGDPSPAVLTYTEVQPLFTKCLPCHANGGRAPDLSGFPFTGADGESLASVMAKIALRTNDEHTPMPPTGLLPVAERAAVGAWIRSGYLTLPPAPAASPELGAYRVEMRWQSPVGSGDWVTLPNSERGAYTAPLATMPVGTAVTVSFRVTGPRHTVVLEKTFPATALPRTGRLILPLRAVAVDTTPPTAGQHGDLRTSDLTDNSATVSWSEAVDLVTPQAALGYSVYQARTNTLDTVAHIKNTGTLVTSSATALSRADLANLAPSTRYYVNVIVVDQAGNEAAYHPMSLVTDDDPNAVVVSDYPGCISAAPTRRLVDAWRGAAAKALERGAESDSTVAQHIKQCFPADVPACVKPVLAYTLRRDIASGSDDVPIAAAPQRQPPREFLAPGASGLSYVIPSNVEQIARDNGWPVVRYKSRHSGGFDPGTPNLLMVYVAGDKVNPPVSYDRWLNFATPKDSDATALTPAPQANLATDDDYTAAHNFGADMPSVFTMVSLERRRGDTPAQVYFQMFDRESAGPKFAPRGNSDVTSCVSCHPNGLRAISPLGLHVRAGEEALPEADWKAADEINAAMITAAGGKTVLWRSARVNVNGTAVTKSFFEPAAQGPIMGLPTPLNNAGSRTQAFIMGGTLPNGTTVQGCSTSRTTVSVRDIFGRAPGANNVYSLSAAPAIRWEKVRDSMNCASCHDNIAHGGLNATVDMSTVDFKILVDQSMPLGAHLNPLDTVQNVPGNPSNPVRDALTGDERIALANCVQAEFDLEKQQLAKWLEQTKCE